MKEGWKVVKIKEVVEPSNGLWKGKKPPYINIAVIRNTNFSKDCKLKLDDVEYIDVEERQYTTRKLEYGDIIIEKSGGSDKQPVGRPILFNLLEGDYSFSNFTSRLRIIDIKEVNPEYLHKALYNLYLQGATYPLQSHTTGIHNLDFKGYLDLEFPLPSLSEQQRIVGILDAAFEKIDALKVNAEKNLENAKALFQQVLAQELGPKEEWNYYLFSDIIKLQSGDNLPAKQFKEGKYPVYGGNGIAGFHNLYNRRGNNIIIGRVGALCGNVHLVKKPFWLTDNGFEVIISDKVNICTEFLSYYLTYLRLGNYARQTAQPVISNSSLKDIELTIPPISEQQSIVATLDALSAKCRHLEEVAQKTIAECDALKQSILRQAFNGEL